jgi:hypothetical protein
MQSQVDRPKKVLLGRIGAIGCSLYPTEMLWVALILSPILFLRISRPHLSDTQHISIVVCSILTCRT